MSHAAQLLAEAPQLTAQERRLTDIITKNGERVSLIINNVLQLSRRDSTRQERIELNGWLEDFVGEFRQTSQVDASKLYITDQRPRSWKSASIRRICISLCGICARTH